MTEAKALSAMREGDQEALCWIIERYSAYVGTIVTNVIGESMSIADVEEVCSDVFLALWQNAGKVLPLHLKGYLGRIARNMALKKLRHQRKDLPLEEDILILEEDCLFVRLAEKDRTALVRKALLSLSEEDREIFLRYYYRDESVRQIADRTGLKPNTVKTRLMRGREKLRQSLSGIDT